MLIIFVSYLNLLVYHNAGAEHGKVLDEFFLSTAGRINIKIYVCFHFNHNTDETNEGICKVYLVSTKFLMFLSLTVRKISD